MHAILYITRICPQGDEAKLLLEEHSIPYKEVIIVPDDEIDVDNDLISRDMFLEQIPTARSVPQVVIDGAVIGGLDNLKQHLG
jgi:glutaredoxin